MGLIAAASFCCRGIQRYVKRPRFGVRFGKKEKRKKNTGYLNKEVGTHLTHFFNGFLFLFFKYIYLGKFLETLKTQKNNVFFSHIHDGHCH